jgi:putative transposase
MFFGKRTLKGEDGMARKSNDSELKQTWQAATASGDDGMRALVQTVVQQVLEAEMTSFLAAENYERTPGRRGYRNGYKHRLLKTRVGERELFVPKDRDGEFQTELFERYQRSEKALVLAIIQMYVEGVSTRKVRDITEALCGLEIGKSQVSALAQKLDEEIQQWRERGIENSYPYLMIDARYEKVRRGGEVISQGVLIVVGISAEGMREVLGVWVADSESEASWGEVFSDLSRRGLRGVRYVVSDDHQGMRRAIDRHFQGVTWQRCQVHFLRNLLNHTAAREKAFMLGLLKTITEAPTLVAARKALNEAVEVLGRRAPKAAALLDTCGEEILAVYQLPEAHRKRMRSTNMLERVNQEIKRRTRVIRIFPNEQACVRLVSTLMMELNQEWMERIYLNMEVNTDSPAVEPGKAAA